MLECDLGLGGTVHLYFTSHYHVETVEHRIMHFSPLVSPGTLVFV